MNLFDQVSNDIKSAMLAKDKVRLEAVSYTHLTLPTIA